MKEFLITIAFVILAVIVINTFISGSTGSMKSEGTRVGNNMINNVKEIEKTGTVTTP